MIQSLQVGNEFPQITIKTLTNKVVTIPTETTGHPLLVIIGFAENTQFTIDTWTKFVLKDHPLLHHYEITIAGDLNELYADRLEKTMKIYIPNYLHDITGAYFGPLRNQYRRLFRADDVNTCYVFLLDKKGNIQYMTSGPANSHKQKTVTEKLSQLN